MKMNMWKGWKRAFGLEVRQEACSEFSFFERQILYDSTYVRYLE